MLNDKVLPFFEAQDVRLLRILTDRGSEYCGNLQQHEYELYLALETSTTRRPKPNHRRLMEFANAFIALFSRSFIR